MRVKICGVPHEVVEVKDEFDTDCHFGQICYSECLIKVNKDMPDEMKQSTVVHEMMHGILNHCGYEDLANDEKFVRVLGNAINESFRVKVCTEQDS